MRTGYAGQFYLVESTGVARDESLIRSRSNVPVVVVIHCYIQ